jgi:DNA invertase Pin-like site-specific DNA recombinase
VLVLGYVRVSTIEQESGFGPEVQTRAIQEFCQQNGLSSPEIICESMSGESLLARHEIKQVLARVEQAQESGTPAHVVFYRLDRLARDLIDQESVVVRSMRSGFRMHSTMPAEADTLNPAMVGDPMRTAIRQFFGIFNQLEKATIQMRLEGGLFAKARTGGSTGGRLPFGYYASNQDIAVHPQEAPAVRRAFALHTQGLDLASIAAVLAREFPEQCGHWSKSFVKRVLDRKDLYVHGHYRTRVGVEAVRRPELVIVSEDEYQRALKGDVSWAPMPMVAGEINWDQVPNPVAVPTLSLLISQSTAWVQRMVTEKGLGATWRGSRMYVSHLAARELEKEAKKSRT